MKELSTLDTLFVTLDNERFPMHGGACWYSILDIASALTLNHLRAHILRLLPDAAHASSVGAGAVRFDFAGGVG